MSDRGSSDQRPIPEATVARLAVYLQALVDLRDAGTRTVSSDRLAEVAGVTPAQVRKDLSHLGSYGTRGVGYDVDDLLTHMSAALGLTAGWAVAIVGIGNLGRALASYGGFAERGLRITALVDEDTAVVGTRVAGLVVRPLEDLRRLVMREGVTIAMLATPGNVAQSVAERLVAAGVTAILNFAPARLELPDDVLVRTVDLSTELQILAFYEQRRSNATRRTAEGA